MSAIERLAQLFARYDKEKELFLEYVKREGVVRSEIDHADESRPE